MRQFFNASHLKLYQEVAEDECRQRILALPDRGRTDLISEIAFPIAWRVNAAILGIEPKDFSLQLRNWTDSVARLTDLQPSFISGEQGLMAIAALSGYFSRLLAQPSSPGQPGLIQQLAEDLRDGGVGETDAMSTLIFMFAVGHSSTVNLIGNTILTLLRHPKEMALLSDPALLEPALSEVLRFESPVQSVTRTALVDTKVGDTVIKRGQAVHLIIAAANRDPEKFSDPDRFDIHRKAAPNLSFGLGIHTCIGLRLAKTTSLITLRYLLDRMRFELPKDDEPIWDEPYLGHGLKSLSVDFQKRH
ncbi:MAG: cytochrome P450 [Pseudomonadota bacterium]